MSDITTPDWVKHAIFYQIYPDRFARSPRTQHVRGIKFQDWGSPAAHNSYQGGDLNGVTDKLDYLRDLGINALYLNPIFSAATDHRYNTYDYLQVDPLLGGEAALRELIDTAHDKGIRVMLDGVFNHCGRGFWPFHHVLENGPNSPYVDWFHIEDWPLRPYSFGDDHTQANYKHWQRFPTIPKLNTDNPGVRDYIFNVARYWLDIGIDAWRLDVPYEIDDDDFWREFRRVVKTINPQTYILGEVWDPAPRFLQGDQFDALMNYPFTFATWSFCGAHSLNLEWSTSHWPGQPLDAPAYAARIEEVQQYYDWEITCAQFNLLGSHDTARAQVILGGDMTALKLAVLLQMTMPGAPSVYYGDEIGIPSCGDSHQRAAFPWHKEQSWNHDLLEFYRDAISLRHRYPALRTGAFQTLYAQGDVYAFSRQLEGEEAVVIINVGTDSIRVALDVSSVEARYLEQVWPVDQNTSCDIDGDSLECLLSARDAVVLTSA